MATKLKKRRFRQRAPIHLTAHMLMISLIMLAGNIVGAQKAGPTAKGMPMGAPLGVQCSDDMNKLCATVPRGQQGMMACLSANKDKLTPACREALEVRRQMRNMYSPCASEIQKFCADVDMGQMRMFSCLNQHRSDLSKACQDHLDARAQGGMGMGQGMMGAGHGRGMMPPLPSPTTTESDRK